MQNSMVEQNKIIWSKSFTWLLIVLSLIILTAECAELITSSDLWWHMTIGRHILATGQFIVDHSIFTWTEATPYHIYNAWLSEITLYLIYVTTGSIGLIALRYLIFGGFFALAAYFAAKRDIADNPLVWVIIALGVVLSFVATLVQPELFSFAFMYITVGLYFIIRTTGLRAWKLCYIFPIIIILWINSHGAFVMSALFFMAIGAGELLNAQFNSEQAMPIKLRLHLFSALVLCIIALMINPFGYHLPLHLLQSTITIQTEVTKFSTNISGWDPTANYNSPPIYALDYLIAAMVIYVFLIWQRLKNKAIDWVVILLFLAYCFLFVKMMRTTHFLAPIFVFSSLDLLAYKENSWAWPHAKLAKITIATSALILLSFIGYRTVEGTVCYSLDGSFWSGTTLKSQYPIEEAEYISHLPGVKKVGNLYNDGGYLMYQLWPAMHITIDQRYFPFIGAWFELFSAFEQGQNVQKFLDSNKADVWLISHRNSDLINWFNKSKHWTPVFIGSAGIVFAPASDHNIQTKISQNIASTDSIVGLADAFNSALILKNRPLAELIRTQANAIATSRPWCEPYVLLNNDLQRAITGITAFYVGDYATAAANLSQKTYLLDLTDVAIKANILLAQRAWNNNDYLTARASTIESLRLQPKNVTNVYNAAIADWQYRKSVAPTQIKVDDDITWLFLVELVLSHQEKVPPAHAFIITVFTAMKNGTLREKPRFIVE